MKLEQAIDLLRNVFEAGRTPHALIIAGHPRKEAMDLALAVATMLLCENDNTSCGECRGCRQAAEGKHPDVFIVEPAKKSRQIAIDQIRTLEKSINQTSMLGGWKVCIIVGADRMNENSANAFLKTLEEPPKNSLILLLTDSPQHLLPTILSRCQRVDVAPRETVADGVAAGVPELMSRDWGDPSVAGMRRAAGVLEMLKQIKDQAREIEKTNDAQDIDQEALEARIGARHIEMRSELIKELMMWYRDKLALACGASGDLLFHDNAGEHPVSASHEDSKQRVYLRNLRVIEDLKRHLDRNVGEETAVWAAFGVIGAS